VSQKRKKVWRQNNFSMRQLKIVAAFLLAARTEAFSFSPAARIPLALRSSSHFLRQQQQQQQQQQLQTRRAAASTVAADDEGSVPSEAAAAAAAAASSPASSISPRTKRALVGVLLALLVMQNAGASLLTAAVRKRVEYDGAGIALISEFAKVPLIIAGFALFKGKTGETWGSLRKNLISRSGLELAVPSTCFAVQNILYFTALKHLDAATYTVLSQSKTAFTAFFFVTVLGRSLTSAQVGALALLMVGMGLVQLSQFGPGAFAAAAAGGAGGAVGAAGGGWLASSMAIGSAAVLLSSLTSAFANVVFEKVAKTKSGSLYAKQLQLGFWTSCFTLCEVLRRAGLAGLDWSAMTSSWTLGVWGIVVLKSLGGLLIAGSITFADNIVKTFSTALAIILTVLATQNTAAAASRGAGFMAGCSMVMASIFVYSMGGSKKK
jgi:UDP-sugar transporter A1/2/3